MLEFGKRNEEPGIRRSGGFGIVSRHCMGRVSDCIYFNRLKMCFILETTSFNLSSIDGEDIYKGIGKCKRRR